jgi:ribosomal protein S6--L-glutamate ligase
MPQTAFAASPKDTDNLIALVGTGPLVVKLLESTQGKGVVLAETKKAAQSVIDAFRGLRANFLVQISSRKRRARISAALSSTERSWPR